MTASAPASESFRDRYGPWAVVLGGSEGLGEAYARDAARRGLNVVVAARRAGALETVAAALRTDFGVEARAVVVDLISRDFLTGLRGATDDLEVGLVIFNATGTFLGPFLDEGVDHAFEQLAINVEAPLLCCEHFGRGMVERGRGGVVLMGSGAGVVCTAIDTPNLRRSFDYDPEQLAHPALSPEECAVEVLDSLGHDMEIMPGAANHESYQLLSA